MKSKPTLKLESQGQLRFRGLSLDVLLDPQPSEGALARLAVGRVSGRDVNQVHVAYDATKRLLDLAICIALLPIVLPLIGICCGLVWLESPGQVLFTQWRTGKQSRRFRMCKIRTMVADAEAAKARYAHLNELSWPDFKITNDPRITRIGRILRKTSLDELPQVFNVMRGEMSLVGPRPTSFSAETYDLWHTERLEVIPGITGLWQVRGRSDVDFDDRVRLDIAYIERRSLGYDIQILFETIVAIVRRRGAC